MIDNTATRTAATHDRAIRRPQTATRKPRTQGEPFDPSRVSTTLQTVTARLVREDAARVAHKLGRDFPKPLLVVGIDATLESLGKGTRWSEVALTDTCRSGCKVYENDLTGERAVAHSAVYGCDVTL